MLPILVASYLNATSAGAASRAALQSQTTDPNLTNRWGLADTMCNMAEQSGDPPAVDDPCTGTGMGIGAIAWSMDRYCQDRGDWLMYCDGATWQASSGNTMSDFSADQAWANVDVEDGTDSWLVGTHSANTLYNHRCEPGVGNAGFRNGGSIYICVSALAQGNFVAAICAARDAADTPTCAANQKLEVGDTIEVETGNCPMKAA